MTERGDFGGRLRQARETRGISLAQIAASTKISVMALEALERNDASRLPGGLFSRAFVRAYAREVGLDPEQTVQEFIARFDDGSDAGGGDYGPAKARVPRFEDKPPGRSGLRWLGLFVTVVLIIVFFGIDRYLNRPDSSAQQAPQTAAKKPVPQAEPAKPVPPVATPVGEPGADGTAGGTSPGLSPAGAQASSPASQAAAVAQPPLQATTPPAGGAPSGIVPASMAPSNLPLRLVLAPTSPCWLSAKVDGKRSVGRIVQPGERVDLSAAEAIVLTAGDAGALTYTVNNVPGRALGKAGEVVTVVINVGNYQSYINRQ